MSYQGDVGWKEGFLILSIPIEKGNRERIYPSTPETTKTLNKMYERLLFIHSIYGSAGWYALREGKQMK